MVIISFLFATLVVFILNIFFQVATCSQENKLYGKISGVSMASLVITLILATWNIFAIILYFI